MTNLLFILFLVLTAFFILFLYCAIIISGDISKQEEKEMIKKKTDRL